MTSKRRLSSASILPNHPLASWIAAESGCGQILQIALPALILLAAEFVEIGPAENAGIVQIVEDDPNRVMADRLQAHDADRRTARDERLLARPMPLHLGGRAFYPQ